jgi:transcriptional regulator with XRE-family HTH domain
MRTREERLGQRISKQRKAVGLTQAQLAEKVNVQPESISRIETGRRAASVKLIAKISSVLELEMYELFHFRDGGNSKDREIEKLLWFALRLSPAEVQIVLDVAAAVIASVRRTQSQ